MKLSPVPRVPAATFRPPWFGGEPRVVTDGLNDWRALREWNPQYLKRLAGMQTVAVRETNGPPRNFYQNMGEGGTTLFAEYLDWVLETSSGEDFNEIVRRYDDVSNVTRAVCDTGFESSYYLDVKLGNLSTALAGDAPAPRWYRTAPVDAIFWCGVLGTSSGLHFDLKPNCNVQVTGQKKFILFPPSAGRSLYLIPGKTHCLFDPNLPDFTTCPLAKNLTGYECTLTPGEALYIPVGWLHQVTVMSLWAINVNFFWHRPVSHAIAAPIIWDQLLMRGRARVHVALNRIKVRSL